MFTQKTKDAIIQVADYVTNDLDDESASNPNIVAEVALDASRLKTSGHQEAQDEVDKLCKEHGYLKVMKAAAEFVPTL